MGITSRDVLASVSWHLLWLPQGIASIPFIGWVAKPRHAWAVLNLRIEYKSQFHEIKIDK